MFFPKGKKAKESYLKSTLEGHKKADAKSKALDKAKSNPKGVMEKNNKTMMEIDHHNRSWNGKKYTK